jgi:hypothetical protein
VCFLFVSSSTRYLKEEEEEKTKKERYRTTICVVFSDSLLSIFTIMNSSLISTACRRTPHYTSLLRWRIIQRSAASTVPLVKTDTTNNEQTTSKAKQPATDKQARTSTSFVMNLFRGQFYPNEIFPYPNVLNEEQKDNVKMLIDPIWKFFEEKNDPAKNDQMEKVNGACQLLDDCVGLIRLV